MKADLYGTPAEQRRAQVGWQPASAIASDRLGPRCCNCAHQGWSEGCRTPRARCELHDMPTTQRARCDWWERAEEREAQRLADEARRIGANEEKSE